MRRLSQLSLFGMMLLIAFAPLVSGAQPARAAPPERAIGDRAGRSQYGAIGSDKYLVWEDRATVVTREDGLGNVNIYGLELVTGRPVTVVDAPGDQNAPAIDGAIIVWQDNRHSGPGGEFDIRAKDLASGAESIVADGPVNQVLPAIFGRTAAWIEHDETGQRIVTLDLDTRQRTVVAAAPADATLARPVLSATHLVWAEQTTRDRVIYHRLRAYDRATGRITTVADAPFSGTQYALAGTRLVWNDPSLQLADLATGSRRALGVGWALTPRIADDFVVWSGINRTLSGDYGIYGLDLRTSRQNA